MANDGRALSALGDWQHMPGPVTRGKLRRVIPAIRACDVVVESWSSTMRCSSRASPEWSAEGRDRQDL